MKTVLCLLVLTGCDTEMTGWYEQLDAGGADGNSDIDTDSDSDGDSDSDADTDTASETESETDTGTETEIDTETSTESSTDSETETGMDTETETETDSDTVTDTDTDSDTDIPGDCIGPGVYLGYWSPTEDRCWEKNPPTTAQLLTYVEADARCSALVLDGASDWHVPNINELQMLVEGCATPGCGVHDPSCLYDYCDDSCPVCSLFGGPGLGGCYWDTSLTGNCSSAGYWSSSLQDGIIYTSRWCIHFGAGSYMFVGASVAHVRCVRTP